MNPWTSNYKSHQGNVGLGRAIAYYTAKCVPIMLPLNDTQKYDLVIDRDDKLYRVSVKTTQYKKESGNYEVLLKNCGGSSGISKTRLFDNTSCDILFILTVEGVMYEIPSNMVDVKNTLTLSNKWDKYIVTLDWGTSAQEETLGVEAG